MRSKYRLKFNFVTAFWVALAFTHLTSGQTFRGAINGAVLDPSGAAVSNATITATQDATGIAHRAVSSSSGDFSLPDLPLGIYTVVVSGASGFQDTKRAHVEVAVSTVTTLSVTLGVAAQAASVEVTAEAPLVESSSTALTGVVDRHTVDDLPLNGRDFRQILK